MCSTEETLHVSAPIGHHQVLFLHATNFTKNFMCSTEETLHVSAAIGHHQVLFLHATNFTRNFMCSTKETLHVSVPIGHHQVLWTLCIIPDNGLKFVILSTHRRHKPLDFIFVICCSLYLLH
jgi:hypothetical protein